MEDMTIAEVKRFNDRIKTPPSPYRVWDDFAGRTVTNKAMYSSIGADADSAIVNGHIDTVDAPGDEGYPYGLNVPYAYSTQQLRVSAIDRIYQAVGTTQRVTYDYTLGGNTLAGRATVSDVHVIDAGMFQKNDIVVPKDRAKLLPSFSVVMDGTRDYFLRNHASVGDSVMASRIVQLIRQAQPMKVYQ